MKLPHNTNFPSNYCTERFTHDTSIFPADHFRYYNTIHKYNTRVIPELRYYKIGNIWCCWIWRHLHHLRKVSKAILLIFAARI